MEAYQKSVQDVDTALARLNATLGSYKLGANNARSSRGCSPEATFSASKKVPAASGEASGTRFATPVLPHERLEQLLKPFGSTTETLVELEQEDNSSIWKEVLELRYTPLERGEVSPLRAIQKGDLPEWLSYIHYIQNKYIPKYPYLVTIRLLLSRRYLQAGYPDLAAGEAYRALLLCDAVQDASDEYHEQASSQLRNVIQQIPLVQRISMLKGELVGDTGAPYREPDDDMDVEVDVWVREQYQPWAYRLLALGLLRCGCQKSGHFFARQAVTDKGYEDRWLEQCFADEQTDETIAKYHKEPLKDWPDKGYVRREIYPWNNWEPDRLGDLSALNEQMAEVAPKLELRAVELPALTNAVSSNIVTQLGVFAKEDIKAGEVVLDENTMLTANNKLQDALCDACNADLPTIGSENFLQAVECPECQVVFCSQECFERAEQSYHQAVCGADLDALSRDVPPAKAADALYALLLLRAMAMAETQDCHPLELNEVKYIWGDFHGLTPTERFQPPACHWEKREPNDIVSHGGIPQTLPFSFEHNIKLPLQMLEKMDINIFTEQKYDLWVINTLYAKFRGTASARLSGLGGRAIRGPEVTAVHPMWCLANHSCDPNVRWEWGGSIKFWARQERIGWRGKEGQATGDGIKKGEEILNHYCDVDLPVKERREWARGSLGGDCMCERCVFEAGEGEQGFEAEAKQ
ncbi:hypothetical protein LTR62_006121 [Meristemomyces frigidus]|uniref:SET domain-containing protein n=1 Tax=Meristemomyces frigidus TaxID=1508187 RepID=A0AAN7YEU7_9PEZI|nr:hypothetical protein LTR62_006121 [Meristemomyces frigidus]